MVIQLNGNATITGSRDLSDEDMEKVLSASNGGHKMVRVKLMDVNGNEFTLKGKLYKSKSGSLTARILMRSEDAQLIEVEEKKPIERADIRTELGL